MMSMIDKLKSSKRLQHENTSTSHALIYKCTCVKNGKRKILSSTNIHQTSIAGSSCRPMTYRVYPQLYRTPLTRGPFILPSRLVEEANVLHQAYWLQQELERPFQSTDCSDVTYPGVPVSDECKTFRSTSSCSLHISLWDMALLSIWITSGSCFALIHPGTNDVPPSPSRSCFSAIPSTISSRLVSSRPRVSISGSFRLVFAQVREPMESFLISDENALSRTKVHAPFSSTDFISARFFRLARFSPSQDLR